MLRKAMLAIICTSIAVFNCARAASYIAPTREEAAAVKRFFSQPAKRGIIDLSIPDNEKAYYAILKASGITPASKPSLFEKLADVKRRHLALRMAGRPIEDDSCESTATNQLRHVFEVIGISANSDFSSVNAKALDSIFKGADDYTDTLQVWDEDVNTVLATGSAEFPKEGDGRRIIFDTTGTGEDNSSKNPVNIIGTYSYSQGNTFYGPCRTNLARIHSVPRQMIPGDPTYVKNTVNTEPNGVVVCLNRSNNDGSGGDPCDYGPMYNPHVSNDQTHVLLPVSGEVDYYDELQDGTAWQKGGQDAPVMWVMPRTTGGGCKLYADKNDLTAFWSHFTPANDGKGQRTRLKFSWPMSAPADFGLLCYQIAGPDAVWDFLLSFNVGTQAGNAGNQYTVQAVFTSDSGGSTTPNDVALVYPIQFQYGCVREGTLITMGDGTRKPIEQVKKGDVVLGKGGEQARVASTTIGTDEKFYQIVDSGGNTVSLTPAHPVPTRRGMLQAKDVRSGDTVFTSDGGKSTVVANKASSSASSVRVYNLALETMHGRPFAHPQDAVFYAGGVMVGDNKMQGILSRKALSEIERGRVAESGRSTN
ncbi:Hint domain-containing protein [Trinickia caryophylli]|uniref:Pretoxin HINT domain-containing protein n=1 Tax=Trinickia caryophylli TaxID=28094 RepID=A0A1X7DVW2_TRICW|nr:Hint domain-containing protein [Trinickia caryophylli]PMS14268.1 hypothetical protein C0Z17_01730 [Trinickia caryophylli]TRX17967.1 hypothetical protein FNF07_06850 [Trinickia caryophylli]WQE11255.1 Hint domain-containing protein [Trinickia caryophylli]SMF22472.1 Pretoxin HINT domain-containing protein [Trinickia caryophylli]GLU32403.1 hypothetical protein Busp01_22450 [Trinickia caryophylli]